MPNTPIYGFPYPTGTDAADVPADMQALAEEVETVLDDLWLFDTYANLPAAGTEGRQFYATDTDQLYIDDGAAWNHVSPVTPVFTMATVPTPGNYPTNAMIYISDWGVYGGLFRNNGSAWLRCTPQMDRNDLSGGIRDHYAFGGYNFVSLLGGITAGSGLNANVAAAIVMIEGVALRTADTVVPLTASSTNYIFCRLVYDGTYTQVVTDYEFVTNTTGAAPSGDFVFFGTATTNGSGVTATSNSYRGFVMPGKVISTSGLVSAVTTQTSAGSFAASPNFMSCTHQCDPGWGVGNHIVTAYCGSFRCVTAATQNFLELNVDGTLAARNRLDAVSTSGAMPFVIRRVAFSTLLSTAGAKTVGMNFSQAAAGNHDGTLNYSSGYSSLEVTLK